ncbi:hypothetical protein ACRALDRAFT_2042706 [Sodiomyces alcalophilus JCM 7366]|uniref:uncharacterized protein n=1 Tax=Sodiomyces alcalophilus JCM 7366 TaxID=591952 RepID=UPI0039B53C70
MRTRIPTLAFRARLARGLQGHAGRSPHSPRVAPFHTTPHRRDQECWVPSSTPWTAHYRREGHPELVLPAAWLRDNCPQSRSPSSGNKSFATAEIPLNLQIESVQKTSEGNWEVKWRNDIPRFAEKGHVSVFTPEQLEKLVSMRSPSHQLLNHPTVLRRADHAAPPLFWDKNILLNRGLREIDYNDWMERGDEFQRCVVELSLTGLVFIKNVPQTEQAVSDIGLQFGSLQETFYGRTWDVVSKPQAENVAYTSEYLGLHSDMLYLNGPPKLQFLHCLKNDATGGESLFSDAGRAANQLVHFRPAVAYPLIKHKIGFHYDANGFRYTQNRPVLGFDPSSTYLRYRDFVKGAPADLGPIRSVNWSPPFQTPFAMPADKLSTQRFRSWQMAAAAFQKLLEGEEYMIRRRLQPGECVVFDNRRILHGRTAFDPASGPRHLRGAYVGEDEWRSAFHHVPTHILDEVRELPEPAPRSREQFAEYVKALKGKPSEGGAIEEGAPEDKAPKTRRKRRAR